MAFNEKELQIIKAGKEAGKTRAEVERALFNYRNGIIPQKQQDSFSLKETVGDVKETFTRVGEQFYKGGEQIVETAQDKNLNIGEKALQIGSQAFRSGSRAFGEGVLGLGKTALTQGQEQAVSQKAGEIAQTVAGSDFTQDLLSRYNQLDPETKRNIDNALGYTEGLAEILTAGQAGRVTRELGKRTVKIAGETIDDMAGSIKLGRTFTGQGSNMKKALVEFISPDADDMTKTILRESTPDDIDKLVKIQEATMKDPRAITPYEYIGDNMADATRQLQDKLSEIGKQKSDILKPLNKGLEVFDSKSILDDLTSLRNSKSQLQTSDVNLIDNIIARAKEVKTKGGADKFIDDVQDLIYTGNRNQTLPSGSALDRQLQGILGKYNGELKKSLPKEYAELNAKYSEMKAITETLNSALGEVVDGVSTRGGSLVKQFFSPNGRKAKELFDYIKRETGIDLAKDSTLARYVMELFDDPRARTLLGGEIPTSVSGVMDKAVDFLVEKTGLAKSIQETQRRGAIEKAKKLTKPSK